MKKLTVTDIRNNEYLCTICNTKFTPKPGAYGLFCSLSCSSSRGYTSKEELEYNANPKACKKCNNTITYKKRQNNFCSSSCAARLNNLGVLHNKNGKNGAKIVKIKHKKVKIGQKIIQFKEIECAICKIYFWKNKSSNRKTCSNVCHGNLISQNTRGKTGGSTKQFVTYIDSFSNEVSLDSSWELKIANELDKNKITWTRPSGFILSDKRRYTPDFYLNDYDIFLDPKAYRKGYIENVKKIRQFEIEYSTKCLVISNEKDLTWSYIKDHI